MYGSMEFECFGRCNCVNLEFVVSCMRKFGGVDIQEFRVGQLIRYSTMNYDTYIFFPSLIVVVVSFVILSWPNGKWNTN